MSLFGSTKPARRPVAEIVSGLSTMVNELEQAESMAATEQRAAEQEITELQSQRRLLKNEQAQASAITSNLRELLGMDLEADAAPDALDEAIDTMNGGTSATTSDDQ